MSADRPLEEDIQQPPPPFLPVLNAEPAAPPLPAVRFRQPPVVTKLALLARCHEVVAASSRRRWLLRGLLLLPILAVAGLLGGLAGQGTFIAVNNDARRHVQEYHEGYDHHYYVKGKKVTRQEYDYFLKTSSNSDEAVTYAVAVGLGVGLILCTALAGAALLWTRRVRGVEQLEEQVRALVEAHPDAVRDWGGPSVLRQRELVEEVLRIETGRANAAQPGGAP
jgi:hypothetical protein